jgi:hypothetical protein
MEKTFQNPKWFFETGAHYPLDMSALEALRSAKLDTEYNGVGRNYETNQGVSTRSHCPVYLAVKTHVLAIEAALDAKEESDFYLSDLFDIFQAVQERSEFKKAVWENPLSNREYPTPYAYLLYQISSDFEDLSRKALKKATSGGTNGSPRRAGIPGRVAQDLARIWSLAVWSIADSQCQVGLQFRNHVIERYLLFILELGWGPSEIYFGPENNVEGLDIWRDLFLSELQALFTPDDSRRTALDESLESLDQGKRYVFNGYDWLKEKLFGAS